MSYSLADVLDPHVERDRRQDVRNHDPNQEEQQSGCASRNLIRAIG